MARAIRLLITEKEYGLIITSLLAAQVEANKKENATIVAANKLRYEKRKWQYAELRRKLAVQAFSEKGV